MTPEELGRYLKSLRNATGLSLRQVEEKTGGIVKNSYLSQIENGDIHRPSPDILYELASVYGVSYRELLERAGHRVLNDDVTASERPVAGLPLRAIADLDESDRE
ncbi:MAG: helix-turn-helix domain-containing protein, partial [Actinomycetota bacterium]|nr:helix-turn-helix domain-containing protein [Actinomycetota bacterium]